MTDKVLKEGKHPLSDALRALDAGRKNLPGIGGQQCGLESYRIVANGNTLEVLHEAADELDRLNMCLSEEQNEARETVERFRAECDRLKLSLAEVTDRAERAESSFGAATEERERLLEERTEARNAATDLAIALRSKEEYAERLSTDMAEAAMRILQNDEEGVKEWARGLKIDFTAKDGRPRLALETRPEIFTNGPAQAVASSGEAIREGRGNPSGGTEKPSCVYRSGCVAGLGCELEGRCLAPEIERKHGVGPHAEHAPSMSVDHADLIARLYAARRMIGDMCSEGRPPKMSIPARVDVDEDIVICRTISEAIVALGGKVEPEFPSQGTQR